MAAALRTVAEIDAEMRSTSASLPHLQVRSSRAIIFGQIDLLLDERLRAARRARRRPRATDRT